MGNQIGSIQEKAYIFLVEVFGYKLFVGYFPQIIGEK